MRKLYFAVTLMLLLFSACTKTTTSGPTRNPYNDPPVIKVMAPLNLQPQTFKPYDQLTIRAMITDIDLVAVAAWEAVDAAGACGNNPHMGSFNPMTHDYELHFSFTIPPAFPGEHKIRLYGVDGSGNIATVDIPYKATY